MHNTPGKFYGNGISLVKLERMFPDENTARKWFEKQRWPDGSCACPRCGSDEVSIIENGKPMPFRCRKCRKHFSVKTGTIMERSKVSLQKWVFSVYLCATSLNGISSMKLHRDLGVTQKTAWLMAHRLREALAEQELLFSGPVEVDETYMNGERRNIPKFKRKDLAGRDGNRKKSVVSVKGEATTHVSTKAINGHVK